MLFCEVFSFFNQLNYLGCNSLNSIYLSNPFVIIIHAGKYSS